MVVDLNYSLKIVNMKGDLEGLDNKMVHYNNKEYIKMASR